MAPANRLIVPIVRTGVAAGSLPLDRVRGNPNLTKRVHFQNFAADNHIGRSVAYHPCGDECGRHNHRGANEAFYVLAGTGVIEIGVERYEVGPGDSAVVPAGIDHNLIGASADFPFTVLCDLVRAVGHESDETPWATVK
jgi:quercetin dioxygenase-like cupin family protein